MFSPILIYALGYIAVGLCVKPASVDLGRLKQTGRLQGFPRTGITEKLANNTVSKSDYSTFYVVHLLQSFFSMTWNWSIEVTKALRSHSSMDAVLIPHFH